MDYESTLISRVILDKCMSEVAELYLQEELFIRYVDQWKYLVDFFRNHGASPPQEQFNKLYPEFVIESSDLPISFLVEELRKRRVHNISANAMKEMAPLLKSKDPLAAMEVMRQAVLQAEVETRPARDVNLCEDPLRRLAEYDKIQEVGGITGLPSPWPILDETTLGFHNEELIMIVARSGVGKTWLETILASHFWKLGYLPLLFTKEMSVKQIAQRFDAVHGSLGYQRLRGGMLTHDEYGRYKESLYRMKGLLPFWISGDDEAGGVSGIAAKVRRYKPKIALIDGMYLIEDERKGNSGWERLKNVSWDLKRLARSAGIPIIVSHQFNQQAKDDEGTASTLKWYDLIIGMYQTEDLRLNKEMLFKILKQREGERLEFVSEWDLDNMSFETKDMGSDDVGVANESLEEEEEIRF
jgi:replicative DNA helicase